MTLDNIFDATNLLDKEDIIYVLFVGEKGAKITRCWENINEKACDVKDACLNIDQTWAKVRSDIMDGGLKGDIDAKEIP